MFPLIQHLVQYMSLMYNCTGFCCFRHWDDVKLERRQVQQTLVMICVVGR